MAENEFDYVTLKNKDGSTQDIYVKDAEARNQIAKIINPLEKNMANRKFVFVGDSYTQKPSPENSFVAVVASYLGLSNSQYHNVGVSGVDLEGFNDQIVNYKYSDANDITDVVITGGINDCHLIFTDDLRNRMISRINTLVTNTTNKFPNATIWAGFSGNGYYQSLVNDYPGFTYTNVQWGKFIWESEFPKYKNVIYMSDLDCWGYTSSTNDGLHPLVLGRNNLAYMIANYLKGCKVNPQTLVPVSFTDLPCVLPSYSLLVQTGFYCIYNGNTVTFGSNGEGLAVNFTNPISLGATDFPFYRWDFNDRDKFTQIFFNYKLKTATPVLYTTSDNVDHITIGYVYLSGTEIGLACPKLLVPVTNVTSLWVPSFEFTFNRNII